MAAATPASGVFISYRRTDNPDATGRIYDRLVAEFGRERVFKDVDSIPLGRDFRAHLNDIVGACAAVIAIIGPRWLDIRDSGGQRRLDDPDDFVRIELEAALARDVPVLPVLVGHAAMPGTRELPASLATLAFRQGVEVRPDPDFHNDATRLVAALQRIVDPGAGAAGARPTREAPAAQPRIAEARRHALPWGWIAAAAAGLAALGLAVPALKYLRQPIPAEVRTEIVTPETQRPLDFALSPDGRQIVFIGTEGGVRQLWLRSLDSTAARPLSGTEGAMRPFWSPDGKSIGYFMPSALKRLDLASGQSRVLTTGTLINPVGGSWNAEGVILYAPRVNGALQRISASGGESAQATKLDPGELGHTNPIFLDNRRFLYGSGGSRNLQGIYLGSLDGGPPVRLLENSSLGTWLPSGWLIVAQDGALVAHRLDAEKASLVGEPVVLADAESYVDGASGSVSASNTGLIAYRTLARQMRQLQWFDRTGAARGVLGEPDGTLSNPRVSPDGRRVAVDRTVAGNTDIWLLDGTRSTRLTFDPRIDGRPLWMPDGREILFYSLRTGTLDLYRKSSEGAGAESLLISDASVPDRIRVPTSVSPDGRYLLYLAASAESITDLYLLPLDGTSKPRPWLQTPFGEAWGAFSPDGRWIVYQSDESGRFEIYVRPFVPPEGQSAGVPAAQAQWQVSAAGGTFPLWRRDGRELYFLSPDGDMMAATIEVSASSIASGAPVKLFATRIHGAGVEGAQGRQYDVAADGRFLINVVLESGQTSPITLIQNWDPERAAAR